MTASIYETFSLPRAPIPGVYAPTIISSTATGAISLTQQDASLPATRLRPRSSGSWIEPGAKYGSRIINCMARGGPRQPLMPLMVRMR